ncbi:hypothetical protein HA402_003675 [Bradysia odoriphaga]|nr:hypothetical protein HA402_003675 [Bradysia odoriphaga]
MSSEHTFCGTWEIAECSLNARPEITGLEGIKFRLDEMGDIIWYNDLIHSNFGDMVTHESAEALFSCETYELMDAMAEGPGLLFGAFAGHNIEFKTDNYTPSNTMSLSCEGWYTLLCKRIKDEQSTGQDVPFTLIAALQEVHFNDGVIKSSEGEEFYVHSPILRLNGFDCSAYFQTNSLNSDADTSPSPKPASQIKISIIEPTQTATQPSSDSPKLSSYLLSPNLLLSPSLDMFQFPSKLASNLSSSFNCLSSRRLSDEPILFIKSPIFTSDSNLKTCKNIFNFGDFLLNPVESRTKAKPPLSPHRSKSPFETPPSSPLTPVAVLQKLPSFMLTPIIQWLYSECLSPNLDEETCEKLINFAESTIPLNRMVEPCRQYLKLNKLKKFVVNVVMDVHNCFNRIIHAINPATVSRKPVGLCKTCKFAVREAAIGCAKVLQFCNIFVKDDFGMTRHQRHEIIKYIRSRLPIFLAQCHQLLQNIQCILSNLTDDEKTELVVYLVPEIKTSLGLVTDVVSEIKLSLEEMCKDLKSSNFQCNKERRSSQKTRLKNRQDIEEYADSAFKRPNTFDIPLSKRYENSANNLKFVLYMYEVKKMRDIYGRVTMALDIVQQKKTAFNEMNLANKEQTIRQNLEQLISDIPAYIEMLENVANSFDEKIGWKEFKFCFKLATSQINGVVSNLLDHRSALKDAMSHICELVQKNRFTETIIDLGLLEPSNILQCQIEDDVVFDSNQIKQNYYKTSKLNLIRTLCEPPALSQSTLSKNAIRLLHSGQFSDMEFEIIVPAAPTKNSSSTQDDGSSQLQVHTFRAHRIIVASRCEWFHKALTSGMQESINRKITIPDTSPVIFRRLLLYLYGAPVDKTVGAESICELMLLADRFSLDVLKDICETTLKSLIDDDSVLCLLGIADRFNAGVLKANCFSYISQHVYVAKSEVFHELPKQLQTEVHDLIQWCGRIPEPWSDRPKISSRHSLKSPSRNSKSSRSRKSSPSNM